jgi:hypothetical protein
MEVEFYRIRAIAHIICAGVLERYLNLNFVTEFSTVGLSPITWPDSTQCSTRSAMERALIPA